MKLEKTMPLVRVIRHGQITIPKKIRINLGIKEGDILEVDYDGTAMAIKPKNVIDRPNPENLVKMMQKIREGDNIDTENLGREVRKTIDVVKKKYPQHQRAGSFEKITNKVGFRARKTGLTSQTLETLLDEE